MEKDQRRIKQLIISQEKILNLFRDGQLIVDSLPPNSKVVNLSHRPNYGDYAFTIQNEAFEPVPEGDEIPQTTIEELDTRLKNTTEIGLDNTDTLY